jgi:hypothetical protein
MKTPKHLDIEWDVKPTGFGKKTCDGIYIKLLRTHIEALRALRCKMNLIFIGEHHG